MTTGDDVRRLRAAVEEAGYTSDGVTELLGEQASAALARGDLVPARRAVAGGSPLETLIRLFVCGTTESPAAVEAALGTDQLTVAPSIPLLERVPGGFRAALDLRPYGDDDGDWWVLSDLGSDLRPRRLATDHVLGIGGASVMLAASTVRVPAADALDLGTGCGIQALHLSRHCQRVVGTDTNPRALAIAAANARLNGLDWELLSGDLTTPVADRDFDLIVCNPPFVVGTGRASHTYRDSGRAGDGVLAELLETAPPLLRDGGWLQMLGNWLHVEGEDWRDRIRGWLPADCDAWVIQREILDPAEYVAMWSADAGQEQEIRRGVEWLDWFAANKVTGVGFGLVTVRATRTADPQWTVEDLWQSVEHPLGRRVGEYFDRLDATRGRDPLDLTLVADESLRLRQEATRGPDGWEVTTQSVSTSAGLRATHQLDPLTVTLVAGCDGQLRFGDQVALVAEAYELPVDEVAAAVRPSVAALIRHGLLRPAKAD